MRLNTLFFLFCLCLSVTCWLSPEAQAAPSKETEITESKPDPQVLKRIKELRGPYSDTSPAFSKKEKLKSSGQEGKKQSSGKINTDSLLVKLRSGLTPDNLPNATQKSVTSKASETLHTRKFKGVFKNFSKDRIRAAQKKGGKVLLNSKGKPVDLTRWYEISLDGKDPETVLNELQLDDRVEEVEYQFERSLTADDGAPNPSDSSTIAAVETNDPRRTDQWHIASTNTDEAWQWLADNGYAKWGDRAIVVAVIDTGVDYTHEDLAGNIWVNQGEIAGNGTDDDSNGFVDDVHGVTVVGSTYDHQGDPQDDHGHGTHVAGIIAAQGNNSLGVIGVAPNVQIMAIKAAQYSGILTSTDIAEAILYASQMGADVINMSFGGSGRSTLEEEALAVAFGTSVLVASAGNNGVPNDPYCGGFADPKYPAAYPYVLGVMAGSPTANANGDYLAGFSNWDCTAHNGLEYEVMAPGVDIMSTLPGNGYAAWDGTSMAAPIVSGMAALLRTYFSDKAVYSSRFIMGQLGSTGPYKQSITPPCRDCGPINYHSADALEAILNTPKPNLAYLEHWLWDGTEQAANNDDDGIVDAGETIELALVVKNSWGQADNVQVTLEAQAEGAFQADPYVTWEIDTVDYGSVGSFNTDDNGLIYDEGGYVTGVNLPFRFTVDSNTPNEHIIPIKIKMTATNGLDEADPTFYTTTSYFSLIVQRGRELPSIIGSDAAGTNGGAIDTDGMEDGVVTLNDSALWIVDKPVLVESGAHLRIGPGAQVQFWSSMPDDVYATVRNSYIQNEGTLEIAGIVDNPAILKPSDLFPNRGVVIDNRGTATVSYAVVSNLICQTNPGLAYMDHTIVNRLVPNDMIYYEKDITTGDWALKYTPILGTDVISNSRLSRLGLETSHYVYSEYDVGELQSSLLENSYISGDKLSKTIVNTVFLKNSQTWVDGNGNYVTKGSDATLPQSYLSAKALIADVMEYNGRTYALMWPTSPIYSDEVVAMEGLTRAQAFAETLGGSLAVYSDDNEADALAQFGSAFINSTETATGIADYIEFCDSDPQACTYLITHRNYVGFGLELNDQGHLAWITGETPQLEEANDPLTDSDAEGYPHQYAFTDTSSLGSGMIFSYVPYDAMALIEIPGSYSKADIQASADVFFAVPPDTFKNNAVLNHWNDPTPNHWLTLIALQKKVDVIPYFEPQYKLSGNFWGGVSEAVVKESLVSYEQDFDRLPISVIPMLSVAPETAYPFVVNVEVLDGDGNSRSDNRFAAEPTNWRVTFNRDMDQTVQPSVSFGPDEPYTDSSVPGDWVDARTWEGQVTISPVATDGYQYIRVVGAVAADDAWLVTGNDSARFRFEVITSGTESLNLQAVGGEGYVDLSWSQDDYDTLLGFNIYRSTSSDGGFIRVNQTLVVNEDRSWRDTSVLPGVQYYYYFTVVLDGSESDPSNTSSATPIDTVAPVLTHVPVSTAAYGANLLLQATATDNISVEAVTLYYRTQGNTSYIPLAMALATGISYRASIPGSAMIPPGVDYYIVATDGASSSFSGRAATPNQITVQDAPIISNVSPAVGSDAGGDEIFISGNNFKDGATVTLGGGVCTPVSFISSSQLSCTTPGHLPATVSVTVTNPGSASYTMANAYTFAGNTVSVGATDITGKAGDTFDVAVNISAVTGLLAIEGTISYDSSHLQLSSVRSGSLISGWSLQYNSGSGTVNFAAASATAVSGTGSLVILEFTVLADAEATSAIVLSNLSLNEGAITADASGGDGTFTWFHGYDITGMVNFWHDSSIPLAASLSMDAGAPLTNQADGSFAIGGLNESQHTLRITKNDEINDSINAYDAALVLRKAVGLDTFSEAQQIAGDVTNNGAVSSLDASYILQAAVGLISLPFENHQYAWAFTPSSYSWSPLSQSVSGIDFSGIFIGDVDGDWGLNRAAASTPGLRLANARMRENGNLAVDLIAITPGTEIIAIDTTIQFSSGATYQLVMGTSATSTWNIVPNLVDNNTLKIAMANATGFTGTTTVLTIEFAVSDENQQIESGSGKLNAVPVNFENLPFALFPPPRHWDSPMAQPTYASFWGNAILLGVAVQPADEVAAFDVDGTLCGHYVVSDEGNYGPMLVYGDDPATPEDEGAETGGSLTFKVWSGANQQEYVAEATVITGATTWSDQATSNIDLNGVVIAGDLNNDGTVNLADALTGLQVLAGVNPSMPPLKEADINGDGRIGIQEVISTIQIISNK